MASAVGLVVSVLSAAVLRPPAPIAAKRRRVELCAARRCEKTKSRRNNRGRESIRASLSFLTDLPVSCQRRRLWTRQRPVHECRCTWQRSVTETGSSARTRRRTPSPDKGSRRWQTPPAPRPATNLACGRPRSRNYAPACYRPPEAPRFENQNPGASFCGRESIRASLRFLTDLPVGCQRGRLWTRQRSGDGCIRARCELKSDRAPHVLPSTRTSVDASTIWG